MTQAVAHLLEQFQQLTEDEQKEARELLGGPRDDAGIYGEITDEDIEAAGIASFMQLEEEENAAKAGRSLDR